MATKNLSDYSLDELDRLLEKEGLGKVIRACDEPRVEKIPSGLIALDRVIGGIAKGRIAEIAGKEGSGKTALVLAFIAAAQRQGGEVLLIENENTFDPDWAALNGVDTARLRVLHTTSAEKAYTALYRYLKSGKLALIALDSVAQLVPEAELAGEMSDANIGLQARINAKAMRRITSALTDMKDTAIVLVNQNRANVSAAGYGPSEITSGGKALPYYMSLRLTLRRTEWVRASSKTVGAQYQVEVAKAKVAGTENRAIAAFQVDFSRGVDYANDILREAADRELIQKSGSWYTLPDGTRLQGEYAVKEHIWANLDAFRSQLV